MESTSILERLVYRLHLKLILILAAAAVAVSHAVHLKTVLIVDTSNEIAGDGSIPHREAIGDSGRIIVPRRADQHR